MIATVEKISTYNNPSSQSLDFNKRPSCYLLSFNMLNSSSTYFYLVSNS